MFLYREPADAACTDALPKVNDSCLKRCEYILLKIFYRHIILKNAPYISFKLNFNRNSPKRAKTAILKIQKIIFKLLL